MTRIAFHLLNVAVIGTMAAGRLFAAQRESGVGASPDQAIEILKKVDAATKAVTAVKYTGSFRGTGRLANQVQAVEGTAIFSGLTSNDPRWRLYDRFRFDVHVQRRDAEENSRYIAGKVGKTYYLVDYANRIVRASSIPDVLGSEGRDAQQIALVEFVHPAPFDDEIEGEASLRPGTADVGGEPCYVIDVTYRQGSQSTWYFSQRDFLPRRVDRIYRGRGQQATTELVITDLVVDPPLNDATLAFVVPDGFVKSDRIPPNRAARAVRRIFDY